jgi:hypothetical protein
VKFSGIDELKSINLAGEVLDSTAYNKWASENKNSSKVKDDKAVKTDKTTTVGATTAAAATTKKSKK